MHFAKCREVFGSLHFRLTVWNTIVVLLMVAATMIGVRWGLKRFLVLEIDQFLLDDAAELSRVVQEMYLVDPQQLYHHLDNRVDTHKLRGLYVELIEANNLSPDGVRWCSRDVPGAPIFPWSNRQRDLGPETVNGYRVIQRVVALEHGRQQAVLTVRIGSKLAPVDEDVSKLTQMMLVMGGFALLLSPIGGYWLAGRATRPLAKIIDTTSRLHPANLAERLSIRGTRDELDRLSQTINGFLDRINAYLQQNREFTANAAHELRSPLAAVQSSLEVALNADRTADEYKELIGETLEECGTLRDLVNHLLLLAETDGVLSAADAEIFALDHIVRRSCEMFTGVAEAAEVSLKIGRVDNVEVAGDASRLRQVINNLLDNAIKFTPGGGRISIDLWASQATSEAVLQVADTGRGIAIDDLPHVFERFYRGDKSRRRGEGVRGTGLGLSICQAIVAAHGGRIEVSSRLGEGTTIMVRLPLHLPPAKVAEPANAAEAAIL